MYIHNVFRARVGRSAGRRLTTARVNYRDLIKPRKRLGVVVRVHTLASRVLSFFTHTVSRLFMLEIVVFVARSVFSIRGRANSAWRMYAFHRHYARVCFSTAAPTPAYVVVIIYIVIYCCDPRAGNRPTRRYRFYRLETDEGTVTIIYYERRRRGWRTY